MMAIATARMAIQTKKRVISLALKGGGIAGLLPLWDALDRFRRMFRSG